MAFSGMSLIDVSDDSAQTQEFPRMTDAPGDDAVFVDVQDVKYGRKMTLMAGLVLEVLHHKCMIC
jgi:hypothetical protein